MTESIGFCGKIEAYNRRSGAAQTAPTVASSVRSTRMRTKSSTSLADRFWVKVDQSGGPDACWPWTAARYSNEYGRFKVNGVDRAANRVAMLLTIGVIPDGHFVCHHCDNPPCCNPSHLFFGTPADNVADMVAKGRGATGDRNGMRTHPERRPTGSRHRSFLHPESVLRGEDAPAAKLTEDMVRSIRDRYAVAGISQAMLAAEFNVSQSTISLVVNNKNWRSIETAEGGVK